MEEVSRQDSIWVGDEKVAVIVEEIITIEEKSFVLH